MLSRSSRVWLFASLWTVARQAPLSMLSRQEYWSGLPCPPPRDLPNPGIETVSPETPALQADSLPLSYWGSPMCVWKWTWKCMPLSRVQLFATPWTLHSMEFSRPECWSGEPFPSTVDFPSPGMEPRSPSLQADSLPAEPQGKPKNTGVGSLSLLQRIFPTQKSNHGLLNCRWLLYQLSY